MDEAARLLLAGWGRTGVAHELGSHQDRNYLVEGDDGRFVLKIARHGITRPELEAENAALAHLAAAGLSFAVPRPGPGARRVADRRGDDVGRRDPRPPPRDVHRGRAARRRGVLLGRGAPRARRDGRGARARARRLRPPGARPGVPVGPQARRGHLRGARAVRLDARAPGAPRRVDRAGDDGARAADPRAAGPGRPRGHHRPEHARDARCGGSPRALRDHRLRRPVADVARVGPRRDDRRRHHVRRRPPVADRDRAHARLHGHAAAHRRGAGGAVAARRRPGGVGRDQRRPPGVARARQRVRHRVAAGRVGRARGGRRGPVRARDRGAARGRRAGAGRAAAREAGRRAGPRGRAGADGPRPVDDLGCARRARDR